jgi:hypothetical protein
MPELNSAITRKKYPDAEKKTKTNGRYLLVDKTTDLIVNLDLFFIFIDINKKKTLFYIK